MRVPLSWLGEWVDLPDDVSLEHVHAALVSVGFEEEDVHLGEVTGPLVVGQVLELSPEPQKNGKTINWCQVAVGPDDVRGIVCGAHNFVVGDKVVVSLPGAVLPGPFPISARKTYGHVSDGMIASSRELGLGDEHDGILLLSSLGLDPEVGTDAVALLGLGEAAVEINVTPDRGYAFSIRGVAREYSHATGASFRDPADAVSPVAADGFPVEVVDEAPVRGAAAVTTFVTRTVRGIDAGRSTPPWMSARLRLAGVRSISLPVDITNYVMLELGQPIHGYDLARLDGGLTVRRAASGETLETLDGQKRTLDREDLVIADQTGPVGLAGVMGGARTEITSGTTDVLIEAATFDPVSIARSARRHKLPSEASRRFERGVDPQVSLAAAQRVLDLLVELAGGTIDSLGSTLDASTPPRSIVLPAGRAAQLIGVDYPDAEVADSLSAIGADVHPIDGGWSVTPPTWRPDLVDPASLVEEVARITGYDRIPSVLPVAPPGRGLTREQKLRRQVSSALAAAGLVEVAAYPFVGHEQNALFGSADGSPAPAVRLANPLDVAAPELRRSLVPGLLEIARRNASRGLVDLALFETGTVFLPESGRSYGTDTVPPGPQRPGDDLLAELEASLPPQPRHVAVLSLGQSVERQPGQPAVAASLADVLDDLRVAAHAAGAMLVFRQGSHVSLHPGRTAEILVDGQVVGYAGELLPRVAEALDLPRVVAVGELDLDAVLRSSAGEVQPTAISSFPAATQDLSLVVRVEVPAGDVLSAVRDGGGPLLESVRLVDDYRGAGLPEDSKSLTFALRFRADDRTLTAAEATEAKQGSVRLAGERFGAALRD
ncbi:phenylalanine--tRNA ligase subunit beta [Frigoribacterium faeni]|uniref:Phenylalanine--tRNA ligase beta subunit n=1 Tax=Frigoribacterium faeni TaxID=145483 RepID=A0A7W3PI97_9MICO|nr:phenylalanine--tRNA ligase subunit beta [Frigoribacterium faeni]MBA8813195.1 phenylalanyl-tRNA synthetase beta chain [Frigoribacterium faeni]GEK82846.1 phenylalanine--tRNA ligase beta subunit [Frigoribacterium faeni]